MGGNLSSQDTCAHSPGRSVTSNLTSREALAETEAFFLGGPADRVGSDAESSVHDL